MVYNYVYYLDYIVVCGKIVYFIFFYINVWLNYVGDDFDNDFLFVVGGGGVFGDYLVGGVISNVLDIW